MPTDLICDNSAPSCTEEAPAFFTDQRYATLATKTMSGTNPGSLTAHPVDEYVLTHTMPDPDDEGGSNNGAGSPKLWLDKVTRTGKAGSTTSLPAVEFDNGPVSGTLPGLVEPVTSPVSWDSRRFRITSLRNETGGRIEVTYGHADGKECTDTDVDDWDAWSSTKECFGQMWTQPGDSEPSLGWFHKYVVTRVALGDDALDYRVGAEDAPKTSLGSLRVYDYSYESDPAWRYVPSANTLSGDETWSDFRGYGVTRIATRNVVDQDVAAGNTSVQRVVRYRGMTGTPKSGPVTDGSPHWGADDWRLDTNEPGDGSPGPVELPGV